MFAKLLSYCSNSEPQLETYLECFSMKLQKSSKANVVVIDFTQLKKNNLNETSSCFEIDKMLGTLHLLLSGMVNDKN